VSKKISICIPVWEQHGHGVKHLNELLNSIKGQTYKNFNIVISDHSTDNVIESCIKTNNDLDIIYTRYEDKLGNSPANTNNTIKHSDGDIIKIMFQDDLFFSHKALETIHMAFSNDNVKWVVNGCNHTSDCINFNRYMIPSWNDNILYGVNTISSPSVLAFMNTDTVDFFDENLVMLMDCEYYYRLFMRYGAPHIIKEALITNRLHKHQISSMYSSDENVEVEYIKRKYKSR
jgi:glycosyltransferase involved in cell wall biosynthesis